MKKALWIFLLIVIGFTLALGLSNFRFSENPSSNVPNLVSSVTATSKDGRPTNVSLGSGLNGLADWSSQTPFLNFFKQTREWIPQCGDGSPAGCPGFDTKENDHLNLDANGYPKSLPATNDNSVKYRRVETVLFADGNPESIGRYIVMYDGEGTLTYSGAKKDEAVSKPGTEVIDISKEAGYVFLGISATNPNNHVRNIRVIRESQLDAFKAGEIFNPVWLEKIKAFKTVRFMDWMETNNSAQKEWSDRPKPEDYSWALEGAPIEIMVALANKLKANPWFNIPHQATDEYITNFAKIVKEKLDPSLTAYVEHSNEVWNWQFGQAQYANQQGRARWGDHGDAFMQWNGMKAAQICDIWKKDVFGDAQKHRVNCVISTQTPYKGLEEGLLNCPLWVAEGNAPCYQHGIDSYAITGYWSGDLGNPENIATVKSWLKDADGGFGKAFEQIKTGNLLKVGEDSLPDTKANYQYQLKVAQEKGLSLVAYEGGQSIAGSGGVENDEQLTQFFIELNRRPEMYEIYTQMLNDWKDSGGTLFNHFVDVGTPSKWGSWGALEYVTQNGSPKYNALIDFIKSNPQ
ncbi:cellulose-binding protein [Microcoleus sp. FACHB-SPT15]|uniref:cellulose-binding protein n=1 Tax=Microcoleus sp. FACHB-SPT15 TaxID=2692830 RepID=UPI001F558FDB|nr:cellulose-binding protein [Microcoleus sp. FACHB-SPT15]